jgi:hypothetical protein
LLEILHKEVDYVQEAMNADRFRHTLPIILPGRCPVTFDVPADHPIFPKPL